MRHNQKANVHGLKQQERTNLLVDLYLKFTRVYPSEESCLRQIKEWIFPGGDMSCRFCSTKEVDYTQGERFLTCLQCKRRNWITSDSLFHRMRSATPWLFTIWALLNGVQINSNELSRLIGLSQSSALHIIKKVGLFILEKIDSNTFTVDSIRLEKLVCKRSSETASKKHPRSDIIFPINQEFSEIVALDLSLEEKRLYDSLGKEPKTIDTICNDSGLSQTVILATITFLELKCLVKRAPGEKYSRLQINEAILDSESEERICREKSTEILTEVINIIRNCHHGVSQKYLQIYLGIDWFVRLRRSVRIGKFKEYRNKLWPVKFIDVNAYSSPSSIRVASL